MTMSPDKTNVRVGLTVLAGIAVLTATIFIVGGKDFLFSRKTYYYIQFDNVSGLSTGNPVQLNGVLVGKVDSIVLPEDTGETSLRLRISILERYAPRIRSDSIARIQTLGLLGDKYIALTSGSPAGTVIERGGEIPAAQATGVDTLLASGGDAVDNIVATASSLSRILARVENGEGLLGLLLAEDVDGTTLLGAVEGTMESIQRVAKSIEEGSGPLGRMIHDDALADSLAQTIEGLRSVVDRVQSGDGLLPLLLNDTEAKERFSSTLSNLEDTTAELAGFIDKVESGDGLLARLVNDAELADTVSEELSELLRRLNEVVGKVNQGDGTAALLLNDPTVYEAMNDILVGIDESKFLRWLVRRKQKKGIEKRYDEAVKEDRLDEEKANS